MRIRSGELTSSATVAFLLVCLVVGGTMMTPAQGGASVPDRARDSAESDLVAVLPSNHPSGRLPAPAVAEGPNLTLTGTEMMVIATNMTIGNLSLSENASLLVDNASAPVTLDVVGNIQLTDNARLTVNDSTLNVMEQFNAEYQLDLANQSRLVVNHSDLEANGWQLLANFYGSSNSSFQNSTICSQHASWLADELGYNATQSVGDSTLASDVDLEDKPDMFNNAHLRIVGSSGFNIWPNFKSGMTANLTLPSTDPSGHGLTFLPSFVFPGVQQVTGITYSILLGDDEIQRDGVHLWNGANVTLNNQTDAQVGFWMWDSAATDQFSGFRNQWYPTFAYLSPDFTLRLFNVSIYSFQWFPFNSVVNVTGSDVGQVSTFGHSAAYLADDNYTGFSGLLDASGTSAIVVENTTVYNLVGAGGSSSVLLENSTIERAAAVRDSLLAAQAAQEGRITFQNTTVPSDMYYQSLGSGAIDLENPLEIHASLPDGLPAEGATVTVQWSANGTRVQSVPTEEGGVVDVELAELTVRATGVTWLENYSYGVVAGAALANGAITANVSHDVSLTLQSLVTGTTPLNGSDDVGILTPVSLTFSSSMDPTATGAAVQIVPATPWSPQWDPSDSTLDLADLTLRPSTTYHVTVGVGAATGTGISPTQPYAFQFSTAPAPVLTAATPSNGSVLLSIWTNVSLTFSLPMNASSSIAAASVTPTAPGAFAVNGPTLTWTEEAPLRANTTYEVTVTTAALSTGATALASPCQLRFTVAPNAVVDATTPPNRSVQVSPWTNVTITFSQAMNASRTTEAFSLAPEVAGTVLVNGPLLVWTHGMPLAPNTTYTFTVQSSALTLSDTPLAGTFEFEFTTGLASPGPHAVPNSPATTSPSTQLISTGDAIAMALVAVVVGVSLAVVWVRRRRSRPVSPRDDPPR